MATQSLKEKWQGYLRDRRGTYDFRCRTRYSYAWEKLLDMGLHDGDSVLDVGAGDCQLGRYMFEKGFRGTYMPIDAAIDGTDLEYKTTALPISGWVVCLEVVEHVIKPLSLMAAMENVARRGILISTPNCRVVDVIGCDPTHVSVVTEAQFKALGYDTDTVCWFNDPKESGQLDTIVAWQRYTNTAGHKVKI